MQQLVDLCVVCTIRQLERNRTTLLLQVAERCMWRAKDLSGLLLLYSAKGSAEGMQRLVDLSKEQGKQNVAYLGLFLLGQLDQCVDLLVSTGRTPEAAMFARTYVPSRVTEVTICSPLAYAGMSN